MGIKGMSIRGNSEGVSPVIATILLVAITVVLAATLYYMVIGFGGDTNTIPPVGDMTQGTAPNGVKYSFTPFSRDVIWAEIAILISDGTNITTFNNITTEPLHPGEPVTAQFGSQGFAGLTVFLNITDVTGNGYVNGGDSFTLTTSGGSFANNIDYEVTIIDKSTDSVIVSKTFQGE